MPVTIRKVPKATPIAAPIATDIRKPETLIVPPDTSLALIATANNAGSAMVVENRLIIYQKETDKKTNEIPVMQSMLKSMNIDNAVITADAMHCQVKTAEKILEREGDYLLGLKGNQERLEDRVREKFQHKKAFLYPFS